ncbi:MAG: transcription antitermination factor NusB [Chitinispirillaceae bacterium]|nr:transcription antitermination factor NusB [Chitinispirillaceae bacterium]
MTESRTMPDTVAPRNRRKARELALQVLYALEVGNADEWETMFERIAAGARCSPENKRYARALVQKTVTSLESIDERITRHAANWDLKRMAALDRNVLRLAVCELASFNDVPFRVVIDEAVELAKRYGTDDSGGFVNGIIDSIRKECPRN